jgi:hypothetical protein
MPRDRAGPSATGILIAGPDWRAMHKAARERLRGTTEEREDE